MYSLPIVLATACGDNAETQSDQFQCVYPGEDLHSYYDLLAQNPQVVAAMELCERPVSFQNQLWDKVREAEKTGLPPDAPKPQSYYDFGLDTETKSLSGVSWDDPKHYQKIEIAIEGAEHDFYFPALDKEGRKLVITNQILERAVEMTMLNHNEPIKTIYATKEEAHEILAAYLANSLWVEHNTIVPWSILDYNPEQLGQLYQTKTWFSGWDDKNEEYSISLVLANSPRDTWEVVKKIVDMENLTDQKTAVIDITKSLRSFRHGRKRYDSEGNLVEEDPLDIVTLNDMWVELIARIGCQSVGGGEVKPANALNIPAEHVNGYFAGEGHRSVVISFTNHVLAHGDDVYAAYQTNTPSSELMASCEFWKENVFAYPKGDKLGAHNSWVHSVNSMMKFPAWRLLRDYCEDGKGSLTERFKDFASKKEIDELEERIVDITNGCMDFPEDNPDN